MTKESSIKAQELYSLHEILRNKRLLRARRRLIRAGSPKLLGLNCLKWFLVVGVSRF